MQAEQNNNQTAEAQNKAPDRLLRSRDVLEIAPISRATLWNLVAQGKFPRPRRLGDRCTVWLESEVQQYLKNLPEWEGSQPADVTA